MTIIEAIEMATTAHKATHNKHIKTYLEDSLDMLSTLSNKVDYLNTLAWDDVAHHYLEDTALLAGTEIEDEGQIEILGWLHNYNEQLLHVIKVSDSREKEDLIGDGWDARIF